MEPTVPEKPAWLKNHPQMDVEPPNCIVARIYGKPGVITQNFLAAQSLDPRIDQIVILDKTYATPKLPGRFIDQGGMFEVMKGEGPCGSLAVSNAILDSAITHTEDTGEAHWQGDMQTALRVALRMLRPDQLHDFIAAAEIQEIFEQGKRPPWEGVQP